MRKMDESLLRKCSELTQTLLRKGVTIGKYLAAAEGADGETVRKLFEYRNRLAHGLEVQSVAETEMQSWLVVLDSEIKKNS